MRYIKFISSISICLMMLVCLITDVSAMQSGYGKVVEMSGRVKVKRAGGERTYLAYNGMKVKGNDLIITSYDSYVKINFTPEKESNSKILKVNENTRILIKELYKDKSGAQKSRFSLWAGSVWNILKEQLGFGSIYEIETPSMVMGVKGTEFGVEVNEKSSNLIVTDGNVEVKDRVSKKEYTIGAGKSLERAKESGEISSKNIDVNMLSIYFLDAYMGYREDESGRLSGTAKMLFDLETQKLKREAETLELNAEIERQNNISKMKNQEKKEPEALYENFGE